MSTLTLQALWNDFPPVDAQVLPDGGLRLLCSTAASPDAEERAALVVDVDMNLDPAGGARIVGRLPGSHRFLLAGTETPGAAPAVVTAGGQVTWLDAEGQPAAVAGMPDGPDHADTPETYGMLTCSQPLGRQVLFGGMARQLYAFDPAQRQWQRLDQGVRDDLLEEDHSAFYGLAASADGRIVAVGGGGEVWLREQPGWRRFDSVTNVMLNAIVALDADRYLVCGVMGVLAVLDRAGAMMLLDHGMGERFLSHAVVLRDRAFVLAEGQLHAFSACVQPEDLGPVAQAAGLRMVIAGAAAAWAVGPKAIGRTLDGRTWQWWSTQDVGMPL